MRVIKIKPNRGVSRLHIINNTQRLRIVLESDLKTKLALSFVRIGGSNYVVWRNLDNGIIMIFIERILMMFFMITLTEKVMIAVLNLKLMKKLKNILMNKFHIEKS